VTVYGVDEMANKLYWAWLKKEFGRHKAITIIRNAEYWPETYKKKGMTKESQSWEMTEWENRKNIYVCVGE
jgi:hypothetical protein